MSISGPSFRANGEPWDHPDGWRSRRPDFAIEILSPSNAYYDLRLKKAVYERIGVREYWIVDPMERSIDCYENSANGFTAIAAGKRTGRVCSVLIPEFCAEVEEVFSL